MKLESLDLNLLLAFDVLAEERSVTRAAARLSVSQPAMSGSLARLRALFGDPLFVRANGQMQPTPRCRELVIPIGQAIAQLREAMDPAAQFRPERASAEFAILAPDYVEALLLGPLVASIRREAPGVSLRVLRPETAFGLPLERLRETQAPLALGLFSGSIDPRSELLVTQVYEERLVAIVRARRAGVSRKLTLRQFTELPQIRVSYARESRSGLVDSMLRSRGLERNVALTVSHLLSVPSIVEQSDLVGVVPERLARDWGRRHAIRVLDLPIAMPRLSLGIVWHEHRRHDSALAWLRGVIVRTLTRG